ncbi:zinc-ribbon domain containing protein [Chloroflexota bacterium]
MAFKDKTLECSNCGTAFTLSMKEQECFTSQTCTNELKCCSRCGKTNIWGLHLVKSFEN